MKVCMFRCPKAPWRAIPSVILPFGLCPVPRADWLSVASSRLRLLAPCEHDRWLLDAPNTNHRCGLCFSSLCYNARYSCGCASPLTLPLNVPSLCEIVKFNSVLYLCLRQPVLLGSWLL